MPWGALAGFALNEVAGAIQDDGSNPNTTTSQQGPPAWMQAYLQANSARATGLANQPLQQYSGPMVAGFTPMQTQGFQGVEDAQGLARPYINSAASLYGQGATPISVPGQLSDADISALMSQGYGLNNTAMNTLQTGLNAANAGSPQNYASSLQAYYSPYVQNVVDATQNQFNNQNQQAAQKMVGTAASAGAWGGDRAMIGQAQLANQEQLAQAPTIAGLYNTGYTQAGQAMQGQQNLALQAGVQGANAQLAGANQLFGLGENQQQQSTAAQQASGWLAQNAAAGIGALGQQAHSDALTDAQALLASGNQQQALAQQQINVPYEQFQAQQAFPYQITNWLNGIYSGQNNGGTSSTTGPAPNVLGQSIGAAQAGMGIYNAGSNAGWWGSGSSPYTMGSNVTPTSTGVYDFNTTDPYGFSANGGPVGYAGGGMVQPGLQSPFGQFATPMGTFGGMPAPQQGQVPPGYAMGGRAGFDTGGTPSAQSQIDDLYTSILGRAPDAGGEAYWTQQLASGVPLSAIQSSFYASPEEQKTNPDVYSAQQQIASGSTAPTLPQDLQDEISGKTSYANDANVQRVMASAKAAGVNYANDPAYWALTPPERLATGLAPPLGSAYNYYGSGGQDYLDSHGGMDSTGLTGGANGPTSQSMQAVQYGKAGLSAAPGAWQYQTAAAPAPTPTPSGSSAPAPTNGPQQYQAALAQSPYAYYSTFTGQQPTDIASMYQQYLGRQGDPAGLQYWGQQGPSAAYAGIVNSPEYQGYQNMLGPYQQSGYTSTGIAIPQLSTMPIAGTGGNYAATNYMNALAQYQPPGAQFTTSYSQPNITAPGFANSTASLTSDQINQLYQQYLGRPADPTALGSAGQQPGNAVYQGILNSPEYTSRLQQGQVQGQTASTSYQLPYTSYQPNWNSGDGSQASQAAAGQGWMSGVSSLGQGALSGGMQRGGRAGFDDGGSTDNFDPNSFDLPVAGGQPNANDDYQKYLKMTTEQLQELSHTTPSMTPQGQLIQKALQAKLMNPLGDMMQQTQPQAGLGASPFSMRRGGSAGQIFPKPKGFDDGGSLWDTLNSPRQYMGITEQPDAPSSDAADIPDVPVAGLQRAAPVDDVGFGDKSMPIQRAIDYLKNHYTGTHETGIGPGQDSQTQAMLRRAENLGAGFDHPDEIPMIAPDDADPAPADDFYANLHGANGPDDQPLDPAYAAAHGLGPMPDDAPPGAPSLVGDIPPRPGEKPIMPIGALGGFAPKGAAGPMGPPTDATLSGNTPNGLNPQAGMPQPGTMPARPPQAGFQQAAYQPPEETSAHKFANSPWLALAQSGAAMMSSRSPFFGNQLGAGLEQGLQTLQGQNATQIKEDYQKAEIAAKKQGYDLEAKKLQQGLDEFQERMKETQYNHVSLDAQRKSTEQHQRTQEDLERQRLGIEQSNAGRGYWEPVRPLTNADGTPVTDDNGVPQAILRNRYSGDEKQGALPDPSVGRGAGKQSVSEWKYNAWLQAHDGDTQGALDYVAGHKQMSSAELHKFGYTQARAEVAAGALPANQIDARAEAVAAALGGGAPAAPAAGAVGTQANPLVPKTQADIDNAPSGTVIKTKNGLMVKP